MDTSSPDGPHMNFVCVKIVQRISRVQIHTFLFFSFLFGAKADPSRTLTPEDADIFFVPGYLQTSMSQPHHENRTNSLVAALLVIIIRHSFTHPYFVQNPT